MAAARALEGVGSGRMCVRDALSSVMNERGFRLDVLVALACEDPDEIGVLGMVALASAVTV
jgi:hypothetical protein